MSVKHILGQIIKADLDYNLIENNDRIAVGVSGGKDSMLLLYCLHLYQRIAAKQFNKHFKVIGIHIEMGFPNMDFQEVNNFFNQQQIEYYDIPSKIYDILKLHPNKQGKIQCSLCSKLKKGAVVQAAKQYNCNKTAFGHHGDDAIETLLLNAIYGGRLKTFQPKMFLSNQEMTFIRPFIYCHEQDLIKAFKQTKLPLVKSTCPNDGFTKRQDIKELIQGIYDTYPSSKVNLLKMLHNKKQLELWDIDENK